MTLKRPKGLGHKDAGTLVVLEHTSTILRGNPLGDPHARKVGGWRRREYGIGTRSPTTINRMSTIGWM